MKFLRFFSLITAFLLLTVSSPDAIFAGETAVPAFSALSTIRTDTQEAATSSGTPDSSKLRVPAEEGSSDPAAGKKAELIEAFKPLAPSVAQQQCLVKKAPDLIFPETLEVRRHGSDQFFPIPISWEAAPAFDSEKCGTYTFAPQLPQDYEAAGETTPPVITVTVCRQETSVSGLSKKLTKRSRSSLSDTIKISPAYGRRVQIQIQSGGKWITKKTYTLAKDADASLKLQYPDTWWKLPVSSWRLQIPASAEGEAYTSPTVTVTARRHYQNPSKYIQIKDSISLKHSGAYKLCPGYMGLKVRKVNDYFHIGSKYWPRYTSLTQSKVKAFQRKNKLPATGIVDRKTWIKMGFSETSWSRLGAYVSPIQVNPSSTKKEHIEAMIRTAKKYLGSDYVVGASGKPSQGADCSGLVMQGLYAAGVDPYPVSCVRHSKAGYEYESRNLWTNKKFKSIPYTKKQRGDLIFYKGRGGAIIHVAIYLGNGKVIESWPNKVVIWPIKNSHRSMVAGVKRVFN